MISGTNGMEIEFQFEGTLPASKSLLIRAYVIQSYFPELEIRGGSQCEDVVRCRQAILNLQQNQEMDCGGSGAVFRFLALRASRIPGSHFLRGEPRLLERPQEEIQRILESLGVESRFETQGLRIESEGWTRPREPVRVRCSESSQFASALALNAGHLDFDLEFLLESTSPSSRRVSESYFEMTRRFLQSMGWSVERWGNRIRVPAGQKNLTVSPLDVEIDLSSAFCVSAFAALLGKTRIFPFPSTSLQPDFVFVSLLRKMGVEIRATGSVLDVSRAAELNAIDVDLCHTPDLLPVLAVLCAFAEGRSRLWGVPHGAWKESNRIQKSAELLEMMGRSVQVSKDGLEIQGRSERASLRKLPTTFFDPSPDHRMAMAAALVQRMGFLSLQILNPHVVNKSFPEFWRLLA